MSFNNNPYLRKMDAKLKEKIISHLSNLVEERITIAQNAIQTSRESRDSETKSSMGDKYETGRAMMHLEIEKSQSQLKNAKDLQNVMNQINTKAVYEQVGVGCIVETNQGVYFIAVGLGQIDIDDRSIFCISLASPIGQLMKGKKIGEEVVFQNKSIAIKNIL